MRKKITGEEYEPFMQSIFEKIQIEYCIWRNIISRRREGKDETKVAKFFGEGNRLYVGVTSFSREKITLDIVLSTLCQQNTHVGS